MPTLSKAIDAAGTVSHHRKYSQRLDSFHCLGDQHYGETSCLARASYSLINMGHQTRYQRQQKILRSQCEATAMHTPGLPTHFAWPTYNGGR